MMIVPFQNVYLVLVGIATLNSSIPRVHGIESPRELWPGFSIYAETPYLMHHDQAL